MAGLMLETPSRIWRRIEAIEDDDMPSLPPVPAFEDSTSSLPSNHQKSDSIHPSDESDPIHANDDSLPFHSTPTVPHLHHTATTIHPPSSTSSAVRFAHSVAISHSSKSASSASHSQARFGASASITRQSPHDTFEVSEIRPIVEPGSDSSDGEYGHAMTMELVHSRESIPRNGYAPSGPLLSEEELDLTEALEDINRSRSPFQANELDDRSSPKSGKNYDYSVSLRSEPKPSPLGTKSSRFANVSFRKPLDRTRTPSLTRTSTSLASSGSSNSTPHSTQSIAIERPRTASPLLGVSVPLPRSASGSPSTTPGPPSAHPFPYNQNDSVSDDLRSSDGLPGSDMSENRSLPRPEVSTIPEVRESDLESGDEQELQEQLSSREVDTEEPTFSSEETPHVNPSANMRSPTAFSSPAVSVVFTPTPAFAPRPRARFQMTAIGAPSQEDEDEDEEGEVQDNTEHEEKGGLEIVTPNAHKRSFLMEVINSTARPRLKFPTPHPNRTGAAVGATSGSVTETSGPPSAVRLNSAFADVTPRRLEAAIARPRLSHPLAQAWTATESESDRESQHSDSPYDPLTEKASFISTTSSHDLTTFHVRANASFDPVIGLGAQGTGIGRFNAGKLNTYLHGLNKVLEEENKALVERLKKLEEERSKGSPSTGSAVSVDSAGVRNRVSAGGRRGRVSMSPGAELGDVEEEDERAEWMEEKAEMENIIQGLQEELKKSSDEKKDAEIQLEDERAERTRDKERWRDRMGEVERGVEEIVRDLEAKLGEAESRAKLVDDTAQRLREAEKEVERVEDERNEAFRRAEKAERALASGQDLGAELNAANEEVGRLTAELKSANYHVREVDEHLREVTSRADQLEKELKEENEMVDGLDQELQARLDELDIARKQIDTLKKEAKGREEELQATKEYVSELEEDAGAAADRIDSLEDQLGSTQNKLHEAMAEVEETHQRADTLEEEAERGNELARQMEEALEAAEQKMRADEEEVAELKGVVASLKREKEREQSNSRIVEPSQNAPNADVEALENELDEAHREVARLKAHLNQSPARKAVEKAKDSKIKMLEKERDDLLERVRQFKAGTLNSTPDRLGMNGTKMSPLHRRIISLMSPKTPGGPLRDMSWLNTTINDPSVSPLISEIARLQRELDRANESIDEKLEQLEDAGFGVVSLTQQLEDARSRISNLEDEIARLSRKDDRRTRRMQKMRCLKCRTKIDFKNIDADESLIDSSVLSLATEPSTPPTKTSEALRANLQAVNQQLGEMKRQWREEKKQLLGEKAVLQDAASRLNVQVRNAQAEVARITETERAGQKARASVQGELDKAREAVAGLEAELKDERSRLRGLTTEQGRVERQKKNVLTQLQRTESDMEDVKANLQRVKDENHQLEAELRANAVVEQKARHLEHKVTENTTTIERLRQERSLLARDHKDLQKKYSEVAEHVNTLREQYKASQASHDHRRHDLDMHLFEIEDLRRALTQRESELERVETEKNRTSMEKNDFIKTVKALEADLVRVRKDAERFGNDLRALKKEKEKLEERRRIESERSERGEKQLKARMRILSEEIQGEREKWRTLNEQWRTHVCTADEESLLGLKMQHKQECKGLIVQIKYLKAKFTRESCLRCDLGYQKKYLLVLLSRFERTENKILAAIARIGFAVDPSSKAAPITRSRQKKKTLKSVVTGIMFVCRARRASELWREQFANRQAVTEALQDVRRKRAAAAAG